MARTWSMRFNLDDFNAAYAVLDDDADKAQFLTGFSRGLNSGRLREDAIPPLAAGFAIGCKMRQDAEAFRSQAAAAGKKAWEPRAISVDTPGDTPKGSPEGIPTPNHNPLILNPSSGETTNPKNDVFASLMASWNENLGHLDCFAKVGQGKHTDRRKKAIARLKDDPDFQDTWNKALSYMAVDAWYRGKSFAIDYLLVPGRAQQLSEKRPRPESSGKGERPLDSVTAEYLMDLGSCEVSGGF